MAEVYTVTINNETPTEITGGRVGHFIMRMKTQSQSSLILGPSTLAVSYGPTVITDGAFVNGSGAEPSAYLYVTSPDEIYAAFLSGGGSVVDDLTIFHNR